MSTEIASASACGGGMTSAASTTTSSSGQSGSMPAVRTATASRRSTESLTTWRGEHRYDEVAVEARCFPFDDSTCTGSPHATGARKRGPTDEHGCSTLTARAALSLSSSRGHMFDVDHATVLCTDRTIAERLAELLERHGLADVPDHIPDAVTWAPPTRTTGSSIRDSPNTPRPAGNPHELTTPATPCSPRSTATKRCGGVTNPGRARTDLGGGQVVGDVPLALWQEYRQPGSTAQRSPPRPAPDRRSATRSVCTRRR